MDLNKKCCGTCADEDCRTRKTDSMNGVFLRHDYCECNGYPLWKPRYKKELEKNLSKDTRMDTLETQMEVIRRAAECKYNVGVICGLWEKDPGRCERCNWNPDKGKTKEE